MLAYLFVGAQLVVDAFQRGARRGQFAFGANAFAQRDLAFVLQRLDRRIAVGDPKASSVGKVAAQFLKHSKLEPQLKSQFIYGEHSRAVLDLVAKGEAEIGLVYRTDAVSDEHVRILDTAPEDSHTPIRYGVAIAWTARNISGAGDFIEFLQTPQIRAQFKDHGFEQAARNVGIAQQQEVQP